MLSKIVCFDIDGTLINPRTLKVDESTIKALKKLKQLSFKLGVVTGRAYGAMVEEKIHELIDWDYYVLNNGQRVLNHQLETIYEHPINPQLMREIISEGNRLNYGIVGQGDNWHLYTVETPLVTKVHTDLGGEVPSFKEYMGEKVYTLMGYGRDYSFFDKFPQFKVVPGVLEYADLVLKQANKYEGLKHVIQEPYIAFGDSKNDLEFCEHAAFSIAMCEAADELKKISSYVSYTEEDEIYTICEAFNWFQNFK